MSDPYLYWLIGTTTRADFSTTYNDIAVIHCPSQDTHFPKAAVTEISPGKNANLLSIYWQIYN